MRGRRAEPARHAAVRLGVLAVARLQRHAHAGRVRAQLLERDAARGELVAAGGVDVAVPEVLAQAEAAREREDDLEVGARLAAWRHERPAQLHERLRRLR